MHHGVLCAAGLAYFKNTGYAGHFADDVSAVYRGGGVVAGVRHHDWQHPRGCGQQHHAGVGVGDFNLQGAVGVKPIRC